MRQSCSHLQLMAWQSLCAARHYSTHVIRMLQAKCAFWAPDLKLQNEPVCTLLHVIALSGLHHNELVSSRSLLINKSQCPEYQEKQDNIRNDMEAGRNHSPTAFAAPPSRSCAALVSPCPFTAVNNTPALYLLHAIHNPL